MDDVKNRDLIRCHIIPMSDISHNHISQKNICLWSTTDCAQKHTLVSFIVGPAASQHCDAPPTDIERRCVEGHPARPLHHRPNCKTAWYLALFLATESQTGSHLGPVTQRHFPLLFLRRLCEGSQRRPCVAQHLLLLVLLLAHPLGLHDLIVALVTFPMPALSLLDRFPPAGW